MAGLILLLGKLSFALIGVAVGIKLGAATRRDGVGLHTIALAAICLGGVGLLALPAAKPLDSLPLAWTGEIAIRAAMLLLCVFIARTFRPGLAGGIAAFACGSGVIGALVWDQHAQVSLLDYDYTLLSSHINQLAVAAPFAWSAVESGILWSRGRRRLALGLSDPMAVRQYLVWTLTTVFFVGVCLLAIATGLAQAAGDQAAADVAQVVRGLLYGAITACVWIGIFPRRSVVAAAPAA